MIEIYTREDCTSCGQFKTSLSFYNVQYVEHIIDKDITRETVMEKFPWAIQLPIVVVNGEPYTIWQANHMLEEYKEGFGKQLLNG